MSSLMKKGLLFGLVAAFILSGSVVLAGEVTNSKDKVSVSLYGQVNRAMTYVDDGEDSYLNHVDNDNSSTRFGFKIKAKGSDTFTAGANLEWEYQQNASNNSNQANDAEDGTLDKRILDVYLDFAGIGTFTLGHGMTASDGTSQMDLSGTKVAGYSLINAWAGSYFFYDTNTGRTTITPDGVMDDLDGNSRKDRFRYDSPKLSGFQIAASTFERDTTDNGVAKHGAAYDVALKYSGKVGDTVKLVGALAFSDYPSSDGANAYDKQINGSLSVLFSGISVTFATGQRDLTNVTAGSADSEKFYYGKLGYMADFTSVGATAFAVDYGKYDEFSGIVDDAASTYALYAVQNLQDWGTELYTGYRIYQLDDRPGASYDDIGAFFLGARIKF